jgi:aryl-alcohol dehydrogenase-like predicted oxidoreductase
MASTKSCTPAQIAIAWVLGRGEHVMALTGTTKLENLKSNLAAYDVKLSEDEQTTLNALADRVKGDRYDEWGMTSING